MHCAYRDAVEYVKIPAAEMRARMSGYLTPDQLNRITDVYMTQPTSAGRRVGQTRQVSIDDPGIVWTGRMWLLCSYVRAAPRCFSRSASRLLSLPLRTSCALSMIIKTQAVLSPSKSTRW